MVGHLEQNHQKWLSAIAIGKNDAIADKTSNIGLTATLKRSQNSLSKLKNSL